MPEPNRWYVSYTVQSSRSPRRYARFTKTFDTEEHAKLFAREIVASGLRLIAGTINPHSPKRIVSTTEIATWLEAADRLGSCHATGQTDSAPHSFPRACDDPGGSISKKSRMKSK
jgi:hypothetical protein